MSLPVEMGLLVALGVRWRLYFIVDWRWWCCIGLGRRFFLIGVFFWEGGIGELWI